jgi:hypothetical protein
MQWVIAGIAFAIILVFVTVHLIRNSREVSSRGDDDEGEAVAPDESGPGEHGSDGGSGSGDGGSGD